MKRYIFIFASLLFLAGCEKKIVYEHNSWCNHDVEVCGVRDPLENLDWLKQQYQDCINAYERYVKIDQPYHVTFNVYIDDETGESCFVFKIDEHGYNAFYCDGTQIEGMLGTWYGDDKRPQSASDEHIKNSPPLMCDACDEFFSTHTFRLTIAECINQPISKTKK